MGRSNAPCKGTVNRIGKRKQRRQASNVKTQLFCGRSTHREAGARSVLGHRTSPLDFGLTASPLIGWGMLSAAAYPVVLFGGWHLPAILPQSDRLHTLLWDAHFYLAFAFFALVLLHAAAALFHALVRRDGVFETMASAAATYEEVAPAK